jgi:glycosyltransferase involved in cell wall biosynthesis
LNNLFTQFHSKRQINYIAYKSYSFLTILSKTIIGTKNVDFIHCHGPYIFDFIASIVGYLRNKNVFISRLVCVTDDYLPNYKKIVFKLLDNINIMLGAQYLTISLHHRNILYKELSFISFFININIPVIYNGVDPNKFYHKRCYNNQQKSFNLTVVAHLTYLKGHELLLKSISSNLSLQDKISRITFAGDGPFKSNLEQLSHQLGIYHLVKFVGNVSNVSNLLFKNDIFVLPSYREGFPVSLIEAQMSGCLTIASNVGANHELIKHNYTGFLFKSGDYSDLSDILCTAIDNWENSIEVVKNGQNNSLNYVSSNMINNYLNLYNPYST